jgi:hypothetical protein
MVMVNVIKIDVFATLVGLFLIVLKGFVQIIVIRMVLVLMVNANVKLDLQQVIVEKKVAQIIAQDMVNVMNTFGNVNAMMVG